MPRIDWQSLEEVWLAHPNVLAAWAFGSAKEGLKREGGDVDIGVLFGDAPSADEHLALLGALQQKLQLDDIDLVALNKAGVILRFEAISGRRLYCRDIERLADFASLTAREYEDEMGQLKRALHAYHNTRSNG